MEKVDMKIWEVAFKNGPWVIHKFLVHANDHVGAVYAALRVSEYAIHRTEDYVPLTEDMVHSVKKIGETQNLE